MNKEKQEEIQTEIKEDRNKEFIQTIDEEKYFEWQKDNTNMLQDDFISENADEYEEFCKRAYERDMEE